MMQLICNGVRLDLYESVKLQFAKVNPLFAFDNLSAERSMSFKLPATSTNDGVLALARVPAYDGAAMRKKFSAVLQAGVVVRTGYLYVTEYDGKDYNAILVLGMLFNLKSFGNREMGSLNLPSTMTSTLIDADATSPLVGLVKYHNNINESNWWMTRPSIDIGQLFSTLNSQGVLKMSGMTSDVVRLIRKSASNYKLDEVTEVLKNQDAAQEMGLSTERGIIGLGQIVTYDDRDGEGEGYYETTTAFKLLYGNTIRLTFPDNTPENLCICYPAYDGGAYTPIGFIGSRRFSRPTTQGGDVVYSGDPLAGQTVELNLANGLFMLMTGEGLSYNESATDIDFYEMDFSLQADYSLKVLVSQDDIYLGLGGEVPYLSVLMDLSIGDLLKMYANAVGKLIGVTAEGEIKFIDSLDPTFVEPKIMSIGKLTRTFTDYAQTNYVRFKESDKVLEEERLSIQYEIDNDNIELEKDLLELNAIEGGLYGDGTTNLLLVRLEEKSPYDLAEDVLSEADGFEYLNRPTLRTCALLQDICDASTSLEITCRMTLAEYAAVDSETGFLVHNSKYTWTEGSWQDGVAKFTLAQIL